MLAEEDIEYSNACGFQGHSLPKRGSNRNGLIPDFHPLSRFYSYADKVSLCWKRIGL